MQYNPVGPKRQSTSPTGSENTLTPATPSSTPKLSAAGSTITVTSSVAKVNGFNIGHPAQLLGPAMNRTTPNQRSHLAINPSFANQEHVLFTGRHTSSAPTQSQLSAVPFHMLSTSSHPTTPTLTATSTATSSVSDHKNPLSPAKYDKSVKHLECFYWHHYGKCNKSEDLCLYAHHETGQKADEPRHVEAGRPAVAGRNARVMVPLQQNWRAAAPSGSSTAQNIAPYGSGTNEQTSPFSYSQIYGSGPAPNFSLGYSSGTVTQVPPPPSSLTQRFLDMTVNQPGMASQDFQERRMQALQSIIELQVHEAKVSQDLFAAISSEIKYCRAELSISAGSLDESQDNVTQHKKVVHELVNKYLKMEREADGMVKRVQMMNLEVNGELAKAGLPTLPL